MGGQIRVGFSIGLKFFQPLLFGGFTGFNTFSETVDSLLRYKKLNIIRPIQILFCKADLFFTKGSSVGIGRVLLVGAAIGNISTQDHQRRLLGFGFGGFKGVENSFIVVAVGDSLYMPVIGLKTHSDVFSKGYIRTAFN